MSNRFHVNKRAFTDDTCLIFFDPNKPLLLATDASPVGVDAVLSHCFEDDTERAIHFASLKLINNIILVRVASAVANVLVPSSSFKFPPFHRAALV